MIKNFKLDRKSKEIVNESQLSTGVGKSSSQHLRVLRMRNLGSFSLPWTPTSQTLTQPYQPDWRAKYC